MIIYLDNNFVCHLTNDGTMREVETDVFDGQQDEYIRGYRFIPQGESWTRADGKVFDGMMISPAKDYNRIITDVAIGYLDDDQAETVSILFEEWQTDTDYAVGDRRKYKELLYRCVQAHHSQDDWTPDKTPALWVRTSTDPFPEWIQPTGVQDAYSKGDKVSHNEKHWISDIDVNVWEPGVYGWSEVVT